MSFESLSKLDLNLLVCFHVLLEQNNVSKAALQLNLSQSAISKNLAKLRLLFNDPLFERAGYGMVPTKRAEQLQPAVAKLMSDIAHLTAPLNFNPQTTERRFSLTVVESVYAVLFSDVISQVLEKAPSLTMETINWTSDTFERLQHSDLDFALTAKELNPEDAGKTMPVPDGVIANDLYQDEFCCLLNNQHQALTKQWKLQSFLSCKHVAIKNFKHERWLLDIKLSELSFYRDIAVHTPDFNSAALVASRSELVLTAPKRFAINVAEKLGLTILPLPFSLPPIVYSLFWHKKRQTDTGHQWLKTQIINAAKR